MAWDCLEAVTFSPKFLGLSVRIFRNFRDCFRTVQAKFWDCFQTVRVEFLGLFLDSSNRIFGTIFGQFGTGLRFGFDPRIDVFRFCGVFGITVIRWRTVKGPRGALFYMSPRFWPFCVLLLEK